MEHTVVTVGGYLEFQSVTSLDINISPNEHGYMKVKGVLTKESFHHCKSSQFLHKKIMVNNMDKGIIFSGIITYLTFQEEQDLRYVELEALTESILMDLQLHSKAFQNIHMTYGQVLGLLDYSRQIQAGEYRKYRLNTPCIQYQNTDWGFLKQLAGRLHTLIYAGYSPSHPMAYFDIPQSRSEETVFHL